MKNLIFCGILLATCLTASSQLPDSVILILNIGQSNAVGRGEPSWPDEVPPTPGTFWFKNSTSSLQPLTDPMGEDVSSSTHRSMNPMLGKKLSELTGYKVIVVPAAIGNTFIYNWQKEDNSLYTRAKTMWQNALAFCNANNITIVGKYAHWLQGENDAGATETDGYYVMLNALVNDLVADMGVEKIFATRIGYDPHYTSAQNSEKIMKAQKLLNFNHPDFIMASTAPPTFNLSNGKMAADLSHHSLKGLNEVGFDVANAIHHYRTTGQKPTLVETVAALAGVTNGYINLSKNWNFEFNGNLSETDGNVLMKPTHRDWLPYAPFPFTAEGIEISKNRGIFTSRPFTSNVYTLEIRFKMTVNQSWGTIFGDGRGGIQNKLFIQHNNTTSSLYVQFGNSVNAFGWDLGNTVNMANFHTFKFVQGNGVIKFYLDGVQVGNAEPTTGTLNINRLGMGTDYHVYDMEGVIDFFRVKNTVDNNTPLPLKFKSFKATNIK